MNSPKMVIIILTLGSLYKINKYFVEGLEPILLSSGFYFIAWYPSEDWVNSMRETVLSAAPKNLDQVTTITITITITITNTIAITQILSAQILSPEILSTQILTYIVHKYLHSTKILSTQILSTQILSAQILSAQILSAQILTTQILSTQILTTQILTIQMLGTITNIAGIGLGFNNGDRLRACQ
jgi:hypothetical protein